MIRINLLPHREMRRRRQQQQFYALLGTVLALGVAAWFGVHGYLANRLASQHARNAFLQQEIAVLDKQIEDIRKLKEQTAALLARKQVVETLQTNRAEVVHLLDQLARQLPDGMYLRGIRQTGNRVTINGYTQSQARVSTLMRNLESSQHLENASLIEIKAVTIGSTRLNEFTLNVGLTRSKTAPAARPATPATPVKG
jgi:type IV pilus assembly protein PilN